MPPPSRPAAPAPKSPAEVEHLVSAAKRGEPRAFAELMRCYRPRIFALALHITGDPSDAEDVTQDAFVRAYRRLSEFEGRSAFFTWLYRIALNRALSHRKRTGSQKARVTLDDARVQAAVAVDAPDPQRACELAESYTLLLQALDELSAPLRTTVVLVAVSGLSHREAAKVQDTTEGTIAWRMHEARRQLRAQLSPTSGVRSRNNAAARSEGEPPGLRIGWPSRTRQRGPGPGPAE